MNLYESASEYLALSPCFSLSPRPSSYSHWDFCLEIESGCFKFIIIHSLICTRNRTISSWIILRRNKQTFGDLFRMWSMSAMHDEPTYAHTHTFGQKCLIKFGVECRVAAQPGPNQATLTDVYRLPEPCSHSQTTNIRTVAVSFPQALFMRNMHACILSACVFLVIVANNFEWINISKWNASAGSDSSSNIRRQFGPHRSPSTWILFEPVCACLSLAFDSFGISTRSELQCRPETRQPRSAAALRIQFASKYFDKHALFALKFNQCASGCVCACDLIRSCQRTRMELHCLRWFCWACFLLALFAHQPGMQSISRT